VDWQPPLRVPQQSNVDPRPPSIVAGIRAALTPAPTDGPLVGPPYLGEPWVSGRPLDPITSWVPSLNLTPMARAAAGLGAELVRDRQEDLVAAIWEQFTAYQREDRRLRALQLSKIVENRAKDRLLAAPLEEASRVLGPVLAQAAPDAKSVGLRTAVGRRVTSRSWRVAGGTATAAQAQTQAQPQVQVQAPPQAPPARSQITTARTRSAATVVAAAAQAPSAAPPPPLADMNAWLVKEDASYQGSRFAPRLPAALAELFSARFRELLLPS